MGTSTGQLPAGPYALTITADNGKKTVNGLTFHVLGSGYSPNVYVVGPGGVATAARYNPSSAASQTGTAGVSHAIQNALDDAASNSAADLVVVYPNTATAANPRGAYYENLIVSRSGQAAGRRGRWLPGPEHQQPVRPGNRHRRWRLRW